jgi:hypothetical protein
LEHISFAIGENVELISLSVPSSVQCCIVISGVAEPVRTTFISHRPALRIGISTARASSTGSSVSRQTARQIETNSRVMLRAPGYSVRIDEAWPAQYLVRSGRSAAPYGTQRQAKEM